MAYQKVLLKLSGEALMGTQAAGIASDKLAFYAHEIAQVHALGIALGVVVGGGNFYRGVQQQAIPRVQGDYMGMLATVMNGVALQSALKEKAVPSKLFSSLAVGPICDQYSPVKAQKSLAKGRVVIFTGGLGCPYFTTDSAASVRALDMEAEVLLKGTRVDGVYTADPALDPTAQRLSKVTFQEAYERRLQVMDMTAFTLCAEHALPVIVFDINQPGYLLRIVQGEPLGTLIAEL